MHHHQQPPGPRGCQEQRAALLQQLIEQQLPHAKSTAEVFSLFAQCVQEVFDGIQHTSLLLLPADQARNPGLQSQPPEGGQPKPTGGKAPASSTHTAGHQHLQQQQQQQQQQQAFVPPGPGLDWSNSCMFCLHAGRGPVVQPPPPWPLACSAVSYAALTVRGLVVSGAYWAQGPHFCDWQVLAEQGCVSMAAVPLFSCGAAVAVLCVGSTQVDAFSSSSAASTLQLLAGVLAPHCRQLSFSTRMTDLAGLVDSIITPIAAQLAQQKDARLGTDAGTVAGDSGSGGSRGSTLRARHKGAAPGVGPDDDDRSCSSLFHKRFESVVVNGAAPGACDPNACTVPDMGASDSLFQLLPTLVLLLSFSKASHPGSETTVAVLLCLGVAAFDVFLLAVRHCCFDAGGVAMVLLQQASRSLVLPVAHTLLASSLLSKLTTTAGSAALTALLGLALLGCIVAGSCSLARFWLHTPLQLVSTLFVAMATPQLCSTLSASAAPAGPTTDVRCMGILVALQLGCGVLLPHGCAFVMGGYGGRAGGDRARRFLPHAQLKSQVAYM